MREETLKERYGPRWSPKAYARSTSSTAFVQLSEDEALEIGLSRYSSGDRAKDLSLPGVEALLRQGKAARNPERILRRAARTALQIVGTALGMFA